MIECKNYSTKNVPVGDVENFLYKIREINNSPGHDAKGAKGVFISNTSFQEGGMQIAQDTGLMIIEVIDDDLVIKLHKTDRDSNKIELNELEKKFESFFFNVFDLTKIQGLKEYSKKDIEQLVNNFLNSIDESILSKLLPIPLDIIVNHLSANFNLEFDFKNHIIQKSSQEILGFFNVTNNLIKIDCSIIETNRFSFLLAHEIGHFILHKNLKVNQQVYDSFQDSEYDISTGKYKLDNYKNWIEWQANEFASNLIMPKNTFFSRLIYIQKTLGISKIGSIFLDEQPINKKDFESIVIDLSSYFKTTKTSVKYRLESLNLIKYKKTMKDNYNENLRQQLIQLNDNYYK